MAEQSSEQKLMVFVESQLKELSPLEARSNEILTEAKKVKITDKITYADAKKLKRDAVSHRVETDDLRKTFTRQLDNLKDQFIKRRDVVLQPAIEAELLLKDQIDIYEKEVELVRKAEQERLQAIIDKLAVPIIDRKTATVDDVTRAKAAYKMEISLISPKDRTRKAIKEVIDHGKAALVETFQYVSDRVEQEKEDARLKAEAAKQAEERAELEAAKQRVADADAKQAAVNLEAARMVDEIKPLPIMKMKEPLLFVAPNDHILPTAELQFEVVDTDALPEEYWMLVPDLNKIKSEVDQGVIIPGVNVWEGDKRG